MNADISPIFVVGAPRSGTHLLRYCLSRHSRIYIAPETRFFAIIYGNRHLLPENQIRKSAEYIVDLVFSSGDPSMRDFYQMRDQLIEKIKAEVNTYKDLACILFSEFARFMQKERWGEKTPLHLLYINQIYMLFPNAKIIHIDREPKNVVASFIASKHTPDDFILSMTYMLISRKSAKKYSDKILTVHYEELTNNPEQVLIDICKYVGESYESEMMIPGMIDSSYSDNLMEFDYKIGIIKNREDKWKKVLSEEQARFVDDIVNNNLSYYKYFNQMYLRIKLKEIRFYMMIYKNRLGFSGIKKYILGGFRFV